MLGQTGSGKTFTMTAIEALAAKEIFAKDEQNPSFPRMTATIQFLEVRNNRVFDLLDASGQKEVKVREVTPGKYMILVLGLIHLREVTSGKYMNIRSSDSFK